MPISQQTATTMQKNVSLLFTTHFGSCKSADAHPWYEHDLHNSKEETTCPLHHETLVTTCRVMHNNHGKNKPMAHDDSFRLHAISYPPSSPCLATNSRLTDRTSTSLAAPPPQHSNHNNAHPLHLWRRKRMSAPMQYNLQNSTSYSTAAIDIAASKAASSSDQRPFLFFAPQFLELRHRRRNIGSKEISCAASTFIRRHML